MDGVTVREQIRALGRAFTPESIQASQAIYAKLLAQPRACGASVQRDIQYGPHERNRMDIFFEAGSGNGLRPLLLFVHGGGFVAGDKSRPGGPFYENIGLWAAAQNFIGINMTYRLAPQYRWPAGAEDVGAAVKWIRQNAAIFGADPNRIFAMGQSAGAVHVASYLAHSQFYDCDGLGLAGAILLSGLYDLTKADPGPVLKSYFGEDASLYREMSPIAGLYKTNVPLLFSITEFDMPEFQKQAALLAAGFLEIRGCLPRMLYLTDHNHFSSVLQLGTARDTLGSELKNFVEGVCDGSIH